MFTLTLFCYITQIYVYTDYKCLGLKSSKKYLAQLNTQERLWANMAECWELIVLDFTIVLSKYVGEINLQLYILDCSFIDTCQKCIYYSLSLSIFLLHCVSIHQCYIYKTYDQ